MSFIPAVFRRSRLERDLEAELAYHLEREAEENERRGMCTDEARSTALRSFGGVEQVKEACRDSWGSRLFETFGQDVRVALRQWKKGPAFALAVVATLALGIGGSTLVWSAFYGILLRPLPFERDGEIVLLQQNAPGVGVDDLGFSGPELQDLSRELRSITSLVERHTMTFILLDNEEPVRVDTTVVSHDFFQVLGLPPLMGRGLLPADESAEAEPVLLLSHDFWKDHYAGRTSVVGSLVRMNDRPHRIVGVLPPIPYKADVFMPTTSCPFRSGPRFSSRTHRMVNLVGRLAPGVDLREARRELETLGKKFEADHPADYPGDLRYRLTAVSLREHLTARARPTLFLLCGMAGLVLLSACANVRSLMLSRALARRPELDLRRALGAGRRGLARMLLTESTLLAAAGGGLGLVVAWWGLDLLKMHLAPYTACASEVRLDGAVLGFTLVVSVMTGVLSGSAPIFRFMGHARNRSGLRAPLVVIQVAIGFLVLMAAGLMGRSLLELERVDPGFRSENVLTARISLAFSEYDSREKTRSFFVRVLERLEREPLILSAAVASGVPLQPSWFLTERLAIQGRKRDLSDAGIVSVHMGSARYFETLGLPLLSGRSFTDGADEAPVAIVNQALSRRFFGGGALSPPAVGGSLEPIREGAPTTPSGEDPLGQRVSLDDGATWATVTGVVADARHYRLDEDAPATVYLSFARHPELGSSLLVRTAADPMRMAEKVRAAAHAVDPDQPVDEVVTLDDVRKTALASPRGVTLLLGLFAILVLVVTASGIGGLISYGVAARKKEFSIRLALGARPGSVVGLVVREGLRPVALGLALGGLGSLVLAGLLSGMLYRVAPTDPLTLMVAATLFLVVAVLACVAPAGRAAATDPLAALRSD